MPGEILRSTRGPYSTLEVSYPDPQDKTVVPVANEKIPDTSRDGNISNGTNSHLHSSDDQNGMEAVQENDTKGLPGYKRPRCGLSPLTFWALAVILNLVVLGAIGGGIAAAVLRRDYKSENANINSIPDPADGAGPPPQSQLSAVNWTDASNKDHKTVFYQRDGKLWLSQWDAGSVNWTHLDIESRLSPPAAGKEAVALNPRTNTPLASVVAPAAADGGGGGHPVIYLYYLDAGNTIRDIRTTGDGTASNAITWAPGDLWSKTAAPLTATANTGLAALAHYCATGCLNQNLVVFQDRGSLFWADGRNWSNATRNLSALSATSLAMFPAPFRDASSGKQDDSRRTQARLMYHRDGRIDEYIFNDKVAFGWNPGTTGIIGNVPNTQRSPGLAAAAAIDNARGLVLALRADGVGNLTSSYLPATGLWNANQPKIPKHRNLVTSFDADENGGGSSSSTAGATENRPGGEPPLAAIALTSDYLLYTLSGDNTHIRQWSWSDAGTDTFRFTERVL
ncbi:hypothetical protein PGQ11_011185 [Apiospora arundinis]|uniref:Fucose-specific lectin n=1 Tax=Apiospora arundinis TaxID=335852 RepID=A0ABR2HZH3_9PEZI